MAFGVLAMGCSPAPRVTQARPAATASTTTTTPWRAPSGRLERAVLTPDGSDRYDVSVPAPGAVEVTAPATNQGSNLRMMLWQTDRPATQDQQQCATWPSVLDLSGAGLRGPVDVAAMWQPGIAFRVVGNSTATKGISVAQNVWAGAVWKFWVQLWDTGTNGKMHSTELIDARSAVVASTDSVGEPETLEPPPWHVCGRVVGRRLDLKIWTGDHEEPGYDDLRHAFHRELPEEWVYPGYPGTYAAHVRPGRTVRFTDITNAPIAR